MRFFLLGVVFLCVSCITVKAPPLIDRHSVMESEAAGEWPDLESQFLDAGKNPGPTAFEQEPETKRKKRVYSILNGDLNTPPNDVRK